MLNVLSKKFEYFNLIYCKETINKNKEDININESTRAKFEFYKNESNEREAVNTTESIIKNELDR